MLFFTPNFLLFFTPNFFLFFTPKFLLFLHQIFFFFLHQNFFFFLHQFFHQKYCFFYTKNFCFFTPIFFQVVYENERMYLFLIGREFVHPAELTFAILAVNITHLCHIMSHINFTDKNVIPYGVR